MASTYYIAAGLIPNDNGNTAPGESTYYIAAGLIPDDSTAPTPTVTTTVVNESHISISVSAGINFLPNIF